VKAQPDNRVVNENGLLKHPLNGAGRMFLEIGVILQDNGLFDDCFDLAIFVNNPAEVLSSLLRRDHAVSGLVLLGQSDVTFGKRVALKKKVVPF